MRIPLVLFSGGLDSTYLVSYLLSETGPVDILYVNGGQSFTKITRELEARDKLIELMNRIYPNKIRNQYELLHPVYLHNEVAKKWTQPNAWMQGAFSVLNPEIHSALNVAYVNDDGAYFGYHLQDIKDQWRSMQVVGTKGDHVELTFPIIHIDKINILEQIDKRLLPHVWVCELPIDRKACQICAPCKLMNKVLRDYKERHKETVWRAVKRAERSCPDYDLLEQRENSRSSRIPYVLVEHKPYTDFEFLPRQTIEIDIPKT